ncbi:MAG: sulfate permease [Flavobacteriales bacterium]|nr:sulfate permease [Flavobacteriales bacterium]
MNWLSRYIPILNWAKNYQSSWFKGDLVAGITVGVLLIPQGMAYAWIAGLPPEYGLYASLVPTFIYSILGTSRHAGVGPVAMDSLIVATSIGLMAAEGSYQYIQLAILLGFMVGVLQLLFGIIKLGFIVNFLSRPVITGFTSAAALIIGINQFKYILGVDVSRSSQIHQLLHDLYFVLGDINWVSFTFGLVAIATILLLKRFSKAIPSALVLVVVGTALVYFVGFFQDNMAVIGDIPEGLPALTTPDLKWDDIKFLIPAAFALSIIGFTEAISIAKSAEEKSEESHTKPNQELIAIGTSNIIGSFFSSYIVTASFSRTAVNQSSGNKTPLAGMISALIILLTLLFLTDLFYFLPEVILAAIIIVAVFGLISIKVPMMWWKTDKKEFALYLITLVVTGTVGIKEGIFVGVVVSLLLLVLRATKPHVAVMGKISGEGNLYRNVDRFDNVTVDPEILIIRFDEGLYYANINYFRDKLLELENDRSEEVKTIIVDSSGINSIDSTAIYEIKRMIISYKKREVTILFSGLKGPVRDEFKKHKIYSMLGEDHFFVSIENAVAYSKNEAFEAKGKIARQSN